MYVYIVYFVGPSVLDVFKTLVKQLTASIESEQVSSEQHQGLQDSLRFQDSLTKTMGEFAGVLPDYQKPDIMTLINSYMPAPDELAVVQVVTQSEADGAAAQVTGPGGKEQASRRGHPLSNRYLFKLNITKQWYCCMYCTIVHVHMYMYMCMCTCTCVYVHVCGISSDSSKFFLQ